MDVWVAVVGLAGVIGAAIVSRWPAMSAEGRLRESIARDAALWSNLPPGRGRDEFAEHIAERTQALQRKRTQEADLAERAFVGGTTMFGLAFVFLASASALQSDGDWVATVVLPLLLIFGALAVLMAVVLAVWSVGFEVRDWIRGRRAPGKQPGAATAGTAE